MILWCKQERVLHEEPVRKPLPGKSRALAMALASRCE